MAHVKTTDDPTTNAMFTPNQFDDARFSMMTELRTRKRELLAELAEIDRKLDTLSNELRCRTCGKEVQMGKVVPGTLFQHGLAGLRRSVLCFDCK